MNFFDSFSLLMAGVLLAAPAFRKVIDAVRYRSALYCMLAAWVLYYGLPGIFAVGIYFAIFTAPVGFALSLVAFAKLCGALLPHESPPPVV